MARLLFFGKLADLAGMRKRDWPMNAEKISVGQLVSAIEAENPDLGGALSGDTVRYVVNEAIAGIESLIGDEDEIAFLPPVSGG